MKISKNSLKWLYSSIKNFDKIGIDNKPIDFEELNKYMDKEEIVNKDVTEFQKCKNNIINFLNNDCNTIKDLEYINTFIDDFKKIDKNKKIENVWYVTQDVLSTGIEKVITDDPDIHYEYDYDDIHTSKEAAIAQANKLRKEEIETLKEEIKDLNSMDFNKGL